ncbi:hypothetical protein MKEN_00478200 [Mycena kentingensis (nom. inval.)]|nr:hypothetical protein MKEN_00478200 [Mycena kentingensis (nom. inval.)]
MSEIVPPELIDQFLAHADDASLRMAALTSTLRDMTRHIELSGLPYNQFYVMALDRILPPFTALRSLQLHVEAIMEIPYLPTVRKLHLIACTFSTLKSMHHSLQQFPNLHHLILAQMDIGECIRSDEDLAAASAGLPVIEVDTLTIVHGLEDPGLRAMVFLLSPRNLFFRTWGVKAGSENLRATSRYLTVLGPALLSLKLDVIKPEDIQVLHDVHLCFPLLTSLRNLNLGTCLLSTQAWLLKGAAISVCSYLDALLVQISACPLETLTLGIEPHYLVVHDPVEPLAQTLALLASTRFASLRLLEFAVAGYSVTDLESEYRTGRSSDAVKLKDLHAVRADVEPIIIGAAPEALRRKIVFTSSQRDFEVRGEW